MHASLPPGVLLGWRCTWCSWLLAGLVETTLLPPPGPRPALFGLGGADAADGLRPATGAAAGAVPPLRVIRRDVGGLKPPRCWCWRPAHWRLCRLLVAVSSDLRMGAIAVGGFAAARGGVRAAGLGRVALLRRLVPERRRGALAGCLATRQLAARPAFAVLQVSALAVAVLALVLLVLLRTDLIGAWRRATPPTRPNRFVINLQPEQAQPFRRGAESAGVSATTGTR